MKKRQSNIELLRIVTMFLVLVVHADFFSLGKPTAEELSTQPLQSVTRYFFEALSFMCVDTFVLISGWFGIKPRLENMGNLIFQCLYFWIGTLIVGQIFGFAPITIKGIADCLSLTSWNWFIKSYLLLCVFAPILNLYIEKCTQQQLLFTIALFYGFQSVFEWLFYGVTFFEKGYSTMSFIGLYLLARYVRLYPSKFTTLKKRYDIIIFLSIVVFETVMAYILPISNELKSKLIFSYISPLVIICGLYLLLFFSKLKFESRTVNFIAISSFAVYLFHLNYNTYEKFFINIVNRIYDQYDGVVCLLMIGLFLVAVFAFAIFLDQPRKYLWKNYVSKMLRKTSDRVVSVLGLSLLND